MLSGKNFILKLLLFSHFKLTPSKTFITFGEGLRVFFE